MGKPAVRGASSRPDEARFSAYFECKSIVRLTTSLLNGFEGNLDDEEATQFVIDYRAAWLGSVLPKVEAMGATGAPARSSPVLFRIVQEVKRELGHQDFLFSLIADSGTQDANNIHVTLSEAVVRMGTIRKLFGDDDSVTLDRIEKEARAEVARG